MLDGELKLTDAIYRVDGNSVIPSPHAAGPWDPRMQHGSAPAALVVWAAESIATPVPMQVARVTIDLMRPVPLSELALETEVLREEILAVVSRHVTLDPDKVIVRMERGDNVSLLEVDIELPNGIETRLAAIA